MAKPDPFREVFRLHKALNERIGVQSEGKSDEEQTKWVLIYAQKDHEDSRAV